MKNKMYFLKNQTGLVLIFQMALGFFFSSKVYSKNISEENKIAPKIYGTLKCSVGALSGSDSGIQFQTDTNDMKLIEINLTSENTIDESKSNLKSNSDLNLNLNLNSDTNKIKTSPLNNYTLVQSGSAAVQIKKKNLITNASVKIYPDNSISAVVNLELWEGESEQLTFDSVNFNSLPTSSPTELSNDNTDSSNSSKVDGTELVMQEGSVLSFALRYDVFYKIKSALMNSEKLSYKVKNPNPNPNPNPNLNLTPNLNNNSNSNPSNNPNPNSIPNVFKDSEIFELSDILQKNQTSQTKGLLGTVIMGPCFYVSK